MRRSYLVILLTFFCPDSCKISVDGTSLLTKVWIIVFLPLWFLKFGPSPAFYATVFIKVLSFLHRLELFWTKVCRSQFLHCLLPSKTVHPRFSFPRVAFLRRLLRPSLDISCCSAQQTFSVQWLLHSDDRMSFGFSFIEFEVLLSCGSLTEF